MTTSLPIPSYLTPMSLSTPTICMLGSPGHGGGNVPTSHMQCIPGVTSAKPDEFPIYPPPHNFNDDEHLVYTYGSFQEDPITSLPTHNHTNTWSLCVQIPIPEIEQPTLLGLNYMVEYATIFDTGNSTIQTDTILTTQTLPEGILTQDVDFAGVYKLKDGTGRRGYGPLMVDNEKALRLSTSLSIKSNGRDENWNHYIDNQYITPKVSVESGAGANLYVVFHVCEYPSVKTVRSLCVEVSATWQKEGVNRKAREEEKRKREEEEAIKAQLELERRTREDEEKKARKEEKEWRERESRMRGEERTARVEEKLWRDTDKVWKDGDVLWKERDQSWKEADKLWKDEERQARLKNEAGPDADPAMQERIDKKMAELNKTCSSGLPFKRTPWGYQCTGGKHSVTFEELGI